MWRYPSSDPDKLGVRPSIPLPSTWVTPSVREVSQTLGREYGSLLPRLSQNKKRAYPEHVDGPIVLPSTNILVAIQTKGDSSFVEAIELDAAPLTRLPAYGLIHEIHAGVRKWGLEINTHIQPTL